MIDCRKRIESGLSSWADARDDVVSAYLHGSVLVQDRPAPRDIDVAVFLSNEVFAEHTRQSDLLWAFTIPAEMELEAMLCAPVDLQVLNNAPLSFRYQVVTRGTVLTDKNPNRRAEFEYLTRVEFFDFQPRREEYLREAAG